MESLVWRQRTNPRLGHPQALAGAVPFYKYADEIGTVLAPALLATDERSPERKELLKKSAFRKCVRIYDFLRYARR